MEENILVAVAWPYANGSIHLGQIAGCYLPADIFARFHRMAGNNVLMVSGSDSHGTPVTLTADSQNVSPEEIATKYHEEFLDNWERLGIEFDLFTSTRTSNHEKVVHDIFLKLLDQGCISKHEMNQPFCETDNRFLADRYVEGTCPNCGDSGARGDQCDACGQTLDPAELLNRRCRICQEDSITTKSTEHFFLNLSQFQEQLLKWVSSQSHWKPNVKNFTSSFIENGLKDRPITRDIEWGVVLPIDGYESKRIYVWFEAVIGYLSASIEWAKLNNEEDRWKEWWENPKAKAYYFQGKDNIPFHTIIWPSILMACGNLNLPFDVPANEYLNLEGSKISTSRNWAVWLNDYLDHFDPDSLRYVLASNMPENGDTDFSWDEYVRANNDELVATYGNLVHRVLSMLHKNFDGRVSEIPDSAKIENELLIKTSTEFEEIAELFSLAKFRLTLQKIMGVAQSVNKYIDQEEPWKLVKNDPEKAHIVLSTCLSVINCIKIAIYPFLPFSSEKLNNILGFKTSVMDTGWNWDPRAISEGHIINKPEPLFKKIDPDMIDEELTPKKRIL